MKRKPKIKQVLPRICGTCKYCDKRVGRYHCSRYAVTFNGGNEFTSTCDDWQQGAVLVDGSVSAYDATNPLVEQLREALREEQVKSQFYYALSEDIVTRTVKSK